MRNASFKASKIFPVGDIYTNHYVGKRSVFAADGTARKYRHIGKEISVGQGCICSTGILKHLIGTADTSSDTLYYTVL